MAIIQLAMENDSGKLLTGIVNYFERKEVLCKMKNIDLSKYGITGTTEIVYNPSYETLFLRKKQNLLLKVMKKDRKQNLVLLML